MGWVRRAGLGLTVAAGLLGAAPVTTQEMPSEYKGVLAALGKGGDFKEGVPRMNIPRNDLRVAIDHRRSAQNRGECRR